MKLWIAAAAVAVSVAGAQAPGISRFDGTPVPVGRIDAEARRLMAAANVNGLAMAVVDDGQVVLTRAWGLRNVDKNLPLQADTIMYGRAESLFQRLTEATLGDPGMPWAWESYTPYDQPPLPK